VKRGKRGERVGHERKQVQYNQCMPGVCTNSSIDLISEDQDNLDNLISALGVLRRISEGFVWRKEGEVGKWLVGISVPWPITSLGQ
jgi:hypothetical protein